MGGLVYSTFGLGREQIVETILGVFFILSAARSTCARAAGAGRQADRQAGRQTDKGGGGGVRTCSDEKSCTPYVVNTSARSTVMIRFTRALYCYWQVSFCSSSLEYDFKIKQGPRSGVLLLATGTFFFFFLIFPADW